MNASLEHSLSILCFRAFPHWHFRLLADINTYLVIHSEAHTLVECEGELVLVLKFISHSFMFESVLFHLVE